MTTRHTPGTDDYEPTPQQFRCAEQAAGRYKAERDALLALVRDIQAERSGKPKSCGHDFDCNCTDFKANSILARIDGGTK